jgi:hypothetical protein
MPARRRRALAAAVILSALAVSGCSALFPPDPGAAAQTPDAAATPALDSQFTDEGSVTLASDVAPDLEVRIDAWAVDPKRTQEWTESAPKTIGLAVNVYDYRVPEKSVLEQKRRVYLSSISISSTLSPGGAPGPFQLTADPRELVPADTQRADEGLLINSYQGGLLIPETVIGAVPDGTTGLTLDITLTLAVEGVAGDGAYLPQSVVQRLPIAIFAG